MFFEALYFGHFLSFYTMQLEPPKYKFVVTHTFRVFWPVLTYLRKGLLRPGSTIPSYPKLIVMEKTIAALMLATPRILRPYRRKAQAATAISGRDTAHANRAAVANAVLHLLSEWCPLLLYLGHVVRECNWSEENNGTGSRAQELLQLSLFPLRRLRGGPCDTVLKYESTIMCTLLLQQQVAPGPARSGTLRGVWRRAVEQVGAGQGEKHGFCYC